MRSCCPQPRAAALTARACRLVRFAGVRPTIVLVPSASWGALWVCGHLAVLDAPYMVRWPLLALAVAMGMDPRVERLQSDAL